jgi:mono/diheme cytochrome c family protein
MAVAMTLGAPGAFAAAERIDIGKREYDANCAACHGASGKGDGPVGALIKSRIPDLTVLSKNNGGVFPVLRVYEVVDGRQQVLAHGTRDMPIWGKRYTIEGTPIYDDYPYDTEGFVRGRILVLIDYLYRLQAK